MKDNNNMATKEQLGAMSAAERAKHEAAKARHPSAGTSGQDALRKAKEAEVREAAARVRSEEADKAADDQRLVEHQHTQAEATSQSDPAVKAAVDKAIREGRDPEAVKRSISKASKTGAEQRQAIRDKEARVINTAQSSPGRKEQGAPAKVCYKTDFERAKAKRAAALEKERTEGRSR